METNEIEDDIPFSDKREYQYSGKHRDKVRNRPFRWNDWHTPKRHRDRPNSIKRHGMSALPRQVDAIMNLDQIEHKATDFSVIEPLYKNSASPRYREHWSDDCRDRSNPQNHQATVTIDQKRERSKYVHLPDIYEKLYISNIHFANSYDNQVYHSCIFRFDVIINLSGESLPKRPDVKTYNYYIDDNPHVYVPDKLVTAIIDTLEEAASNGLHILLNCKAGTNRSPLIAILWAMRRHEIPTDDKPAEFWINYLEQCKLSNGYDSWDTLTNQSYVRRLLYLT